MSPDYDELRRMDKKHDRIFNSYCSICKCNTLHVEDTVPDSDSATKWHCMICGNEKDHGGGNAPVLA